MKALKHKGDEGPAVFRFKARLLRDPHETKVDSWTLSVPERISKKFPPRRMTKVEGIINGHPFRAVLQPNGSKSHSLQVKKAMRTGAGATAGDRVELFILGPEPDPKVPADLRVAFRSSAAAQTRWKELTVTNRRDWIRWINGAKQAETRARRVALAVKWLSASTKRQPCCFNVYDYMLCRVVEHGGRPKKGVIYSRSS